MQTRSSRQHRAHSESSENPLAMTIKPRPWGEASQAQLPKAVQRQPGQTGLIDLFSHDPGPRPTPTLLQAKLTVGQPNGRYEQEADRVAEQVMSTPDSQPTVQREGLPEEEEDLQTKSLGGAIQREAMPEEGEEIQAKPLSATITPLVQREAMPEEEEEEIQMKRSSGGGFEAGGDFESRLSSSKGGGSPLPDDVRGFMEPRFGADFGGVRVHTGGEAVQMNREVNAQAFAHGQDVYFGAGKAPGKDALTAHELTHVMQQAGVIQAKGEAEGLIQRSDSEEEQSNNGAGGASNQSGAEGTAGSEQSYQPSNFEWTNNPLYNFFTNNAVVGTSSLLEQGGNMKNYNSLRSRSVPGLLEKVPASSAFTWLGGKFGGWKGAKTVMETETKVANGLGKIFPGLTKLNPVLGFLGIKSGIDDLGKASKQYSKDKVGGAAEFISSGAGLGSSLISAGISTGALAGKGLSALGATGIGGSIGSVASALGPVGAVLGAGAGGFAAGKLAAPHLADLASWVDNTWNGVSSEPVQNANGSYSPNQSYKNTLGYKINQDKVGAVADLIPGGEAGKHGADAASWIDNKVHGVSSEPVQNANGSYSPNQSYKNTWGYKINQWLENKD
jgi:hypothetical protein